MNMHECSIDRHRSSTPMTEPLDDLHEDMELTPEERWRALETLDAVSEPGRTVLVAGVLEGRPMVDIAASLDLPLSSTYRCLRRARHHFEAAWRRRLDHERRLGFLKVRADAGLLLALLAVAPRQDGEAVRARLRASTGF